MVYKGSEIDTEMIKGFVTVVYAGDEVVFHSIEEAKQFIDEQEVE